MKKVLVAGATGGLGKKVLQELKHRGYFVRALAVNAKGADKIKDIADEVVIGDASKPESIVHLCEQIDIVFSAIGKNVSLFANDDQSFFDIDYQANKNLIEQAKKNGVKRFVYISIYGSDLYGDAELANVHRKIEKELLSSQMSVTIIRPVALFLGLLDVLRMAKNGVVITVGSGKNKTNPIHEDDLAKVCVDHLEEGPTILEVGGPNIYTRDQIAEFAIKAVGGNVQHVHLPETIVNGSLPLLQFYDQT